jgi:radical SAM protein (TIGR01212 family)
LPIEEQIENARKRVDAKIPASIAPEDRRYIAYFQSYTNTYGNVDRLRALYTEAISHPQIVALDIGTRPDCLPPEMVEMLRELQLSSGKPVWVELGLQTIHEETAKRIRRGYELPVFEDAYQKLKENGLEVIVHVILGLPGESHQDMLETVEYLSSLTPTLDGIKLQLLHILKGTELACEYEANPFPLFTLDSYCDLIVDCLKRLPPETVVHRLTGDGPKRLLVAPLWSADKKRVLNTLSRKIQEG